LLNASKKSVYTSFRNFCGVLREKYQDHSSTTTKKDKKQEKKEKKSKRESNKNPPTDLPVTTDTQ
jgi:hypothetical protein